MQLNERIVNTVEIKKLKKEMGIMLEQEDLKLTQRETGTNMGIGKQSTFMFVQLNEVGEATYTGLKILVIICRQKGRE